MPSVVVQGAAAAAAGEVSKLELVLNHHHVWLSVPLTGITGIQVTCGYLLVVRLVTLALACQRAGGGAVLVPCVAVDVGAAGD